MTTTENNHECVRVDRDGQNLCFMDVTLPTYAEVKISREGVVWVNINDSCVFRLCKAKYLKVDNEYKEQ